MDVNSISILLLGLFDLVIFVLNYFEKDYKKALITDLFLLILSISLGIITAMELNGSLSTAYLLIYGMLGVYALIRTFYDAYALITGEAEKTGLL